MESFTRLATGNRHIITLPDYLSVTRTANEQSSPVQTPDSIRSLKEDASSERTSVDLARSFVSDYSS